MRFHPHKKFGGAIFLLPSFVNSEKHSEQTEPRKRARGRQREGDRRYAPVCPAARWAQVGRQTVQYFSKVAVMINISTWKKFKLCQSSKRPKNLECFQKPASMTEKLRFESFFLQRALTEPAEPRPGAGLRKGQGNERAGTSEPLHLPRGPGSAWWGWRFLPHGYRAALLYSEMIHSVAVLNPLYIRGSQMVFAPQGTLGSVEGQCLHAKTRGRMLLASSETTDAGSTSYRFSQRAVRPKHPHGQGYSTGSSIIYTCICVYIHIHTIMYIYYICKYTVYLIGTYVLYEICVSHIQFWSCEKLN